MSARVAVAGQKNRRMGLTFLASVESNSQTGKSCVDRMHGEATYLTTMQPEVHTVKFSM